MLPFVITHSRTAIHTSAMNVGFEFAVPSILVELRSVHESNVGLIFSINDRHPHHFAKHCWFTV